MTQPYCHVKELCHTYISKPKLMIILVHNICVTFCSPYYAYYDMSFRCDSSGMFSTSFSPNPNSRSGEGLWGWGGEGGCDTPSS